MISLADGLPADVAAELDPEWRANEAEYWRRRDSLIRSHYGQWIAFDHGSVIASGLSAVDVLHDGAEAGGHPYVARVGFEDEPCRMRRIVFPYDVAYPGEPIPRISAEFRTSPGSPGLVLPDVILDTGADASVIPWADCKSMGLKSSQGIPARIGGVAGSSAATMIFAVKVVIDGQEYRCRLQADYMSDERILGREVLNRLEILLRGPSREVVINP